MSEAALLIDRDGHIVTLTMNRPRYKNAMNPEVLCRFADAWEMINADADIRVVILTGAGGIFSAGADLDAVARRWQSGEPPRDDFERCFREDPTIMWKGLLRDYRCVKPIIAAVEGPCIAGGTEILESTDIRVAGEGATFGISEVRWSLFPLAGSTVRLRRQIPYTKAMEMLLTGDHYSAAEALQMGLIGRVVPTGHALATAREIAARVAANGPLAVQGIKKSVQETDGLPEKQALAIEFEIGMGVVVSEDAREGPRAFLEKRPAQYKGR
ncbi:MAG TPA: crotonase/enoyl-CoA hydratase family protein [Candidatus Binatia bacterium]